MDFNRVTTAINSSVSTFGNPAKIIKPDMEKRSKRIRTIRNLTFAGIFICFFGFAACGILLTNFADIDLLPLIAIPFIGFITCGITTALNSVNQMRYKSIIQIIENIKIKDKVLIVQLPSVGTEAQMVEIVKKLIETQNIVGYELISNKLVAKEELGISEQKANEEYDKFVMRNSMGYMPGAFFPNNRVNNFGNVDVNTFTANNDTENSNYSQNNSYYENGNYNTNYYNDDAYGTKMENEGRYGKNYCPSCGAPIGESDKFCTNCGNRL